MLHFHEQPHAGKPADVTFMHLSAAAEIISDIIVSLFGRVIHF
jgi:hypothetical protein